MHTAGSTAQGLRLERPGGVSKASRGGEFSLAAQSVSSASSQPCPHSRAWCPHGTLDKRLGGRRRDC